MANLSDEQRDRLKRLARDHGIDLATEAGRFFAEWLVKFPKLAKRPLLAKILWALAGGKR